MWLHLLVIGLGGFLGAISRFLISEHIQNISKKQIFPYGTLAVNLLGCLIIGIIFGLVINYQFFSERTRLFIITGFLGSLTTFSTFGHETFVLMEDNEILLAFINIFAQVAFGLAAVWLGYILSRLIPFCINCVVSKFLI